MYLKKGTNDTNAYCILLHLRIFSLLKLLIMISLRYVLSWKKLTLGIGYIFSWVRFLLGMFSPDTKLYSTLS